MGLLTDIFNSFTGIKALTPADPQMIQMTTSIGNDTVY